MHNIAVCTNSTDRDHRWLEWFEQKFSGLPDEINFEQFKNALHIKEVKLFLVLYYFYVNLWIHISYYSHACIVLLC